MAGEFLIAQEQIQGAILKADADRSMNTETMTRALLAELLNQLAKHHSQEELKALLLYQLDQIAEDEFVITRGC
ncbi:hypothetical protein G8770_07850 [Aestuariicella hydrocarbonica]|uniref:Uncharacterized protein n=1 Tax=Pseudomaricurvus hydrocarbonicus TaxID=1470433 RepID=A0A9E5MM47_9GAMM|nr:hypothetical protein [Aestuariicella hydrocarbonica]NHO65450.1 hypothetical protein [Aestuariicella hydrocarbonica]